MLRSINRNGLYWYCPDCRQTMPVSPTINHLLRQGELSQTKLINLDYITQ
ncbi:hypothetical protein J0895_09985 [Phormidium pseudopriestleyi FRX01]|uniref:Uncharacterized protein n=1 Tax=Phormidium pseudopriestleyi FRX01 TaxID=1759528 RepID=A0ABS3FQR9_9CYAN|nr:hypothetical protein [Phormidium pseudopriestleyi]MBO0349430.1 hypothetical protein [Phormidium pseudopriestleyi FRX01]